MTKDELKIGSKYKFKYTDDKLIYLGPKTYPGNGTWHQFKKIGDLREVWCEITDNDLHLIEPINSGN